jgi:hypothetical protein
MDRFAPTDEVPEETGGHAMTMVKQYPDAAQSNAVTSACVAAGMPAGAVNSFAFKAYERGEFIATAEGISQWEKTVSIIRAPSKQTRLQVFIQVRQPR